MCINIRSRDKLSLSFLRADFIHTQRVTRIMCTALAMQAHRQPGGTGTNTARFLSLQAQATSLVAQVEILKNQLATMLYTLNDFGADL